MSSSYRLTLENWLSTLDVKANTVLGIGDSQLRTDHRVKSWNVENYIIADLPNPHKDSPKPDIEMDLNLFFPGMGKYEMIFCLEVFDYIYDPMMAMTNISKMLADNGTAWVTFPSFYPTHQPIEDDALLYKEHGIRKLANAVGLEIVRMMPRRPETNALQQFFSAERLRAAKNYDHAVLGWIVEFTK